MNDPNRDQRGRFTKGNCANPNGRPKKPRSEKLEAAIREVEQEKGKEIFKHFVERAFVSDQVLAVLFRKVLPDLRAIEANISNEQREKAIRDEKKAIDDIIKTAQALDTAPDALAR